MVKAQENTLIARGPFHGVRRVPLPEALEALAREVSGEAPLERSCPGNATQDQRESTARYQVLFAEFAAAVVAPAMEPDDPRFADRGRFEAVRDQTLARRLSAVWEVLDEEGQGALLQYAQGLAREAGDLAGPAGDKRAPWPSAQGWSARPWLRVADVMLSPESMDAVESVARACSTHNLTLGDFLERMRLARRSL